MSITRDQWLHWNAMLVSSVDPEAARAALIRCEIGFWLFVAAAATYTGLDVYGALGLGASVDAYALGAGGGGLSLDDLPSWLSDAIMTFGVVQEIAILALFVSFFLCLGAGRTVSSALGLGDFRWSWGWTVASNFVPFVNLVRPWFGLAEIHGSLTRTAELDLQGSQWRNASFARMTVVFAVFSTLAGLLTYAVYDGILPVLFANGALMADEVDRAMVMRTNWVLAVLAIDVVGTGFAVYYLRTMVAAAHSLVGRG